jgi:hypothetical protein
MIEYFNHPTHNDKWIVDLYKGKKGGYFVEAGAMGGIAGSCTYTLEKFFHWTGLLVEPGLPFKNLAKNRPGSICENVCITDKNGRVLFVDSNISGYSGIKEKLIQEDLKNRERWGKPRDQWESSGYNENKAGYPALGTEENKATLEGMTALIDYWGSAESGIAVDSEPGIAG